MSGGAVSQVSPTNVPPEQSRDEQVCELAQTLHAAPLPPHAAEVVPGWHTLPWQQPLGQVAALQLATHEVPSHAVLLPQIVHVAPPVPQAAFRVPTWHTLP